MSVVFLAFDDWQESKHPRDEDGQFATSGSGGGGKKWRLNSALKKVAASAGYKQTKDTNGLPTWIHPSGAKIVFHAPPEGAKVSSKWTSSKPGYTDKSGNGMKLAELLRVAVQQAKAQHVQQTAATAAQSKPQLTTEQQKAHENTQKFTVAANGFLKEKGYSSAEAGPGNTVVMSKSNGAKVQINPATGAWIAEAPGHVAKSGVGLENLEKLLSGQPAVFKAGETPPWQNHYGDPIQTKSEKDKASQKQKLVDAIHEHYSDLKAAAPKPTGKQANALSAYGGSGYSSINSALRHGGLSGHVQSHVKQLDAYLAESKLPDNMTLYRGVKGEYAKILKSILLEGTKFVDKGYGSTSVKKEFSDSWSDGGLLFKINVKKGQRGAAIGDYSGHHNEFEVLLPRNTVYTVKTYDPHSGHVEVDVEHLQ